MSSTPQPCELDALAAYELWAENYPPTAHNPLMRVEQSVMLEHLPEVRGSSVLDLACGSGRYSRLLAERGAGQIVAADFSPAMLHQVSGARRVRAGLTSLPFAAYTFDLVVSGLALGHANDLNLCLSEVSRVLKQDGMLLYSDFHADAARAGLTRSFKDAEARSFTVPTPDYGLVAHRSAAALAGFEVEVERELRAGIELREDFPGSAEFYRRHAGIALVLVIRARRVR